MATDDTDISGRAESEEHPLMEYVEHAVGPALTAYAYLFVPGVDPYGRENARRAVLHRVCTLLEEAAAAAMQRAPSALQEEELAAVRAGADSLRTSAQMAGAQGWPVARAQAEWYAAVLERMGEASLLASPKPSLPREPGA